MSEIKNLLIEEFGSQLAEVGTMEVGGEKYKDAMGGITALADRIIEIEKLERGEIEGDAKLDIQEKEHELHVKQARSEKHNRWIQTGIDVAKFVGGCGLAAWAFVASMKYEDKGIIPTTEGGRTALRSLFKFMK